MKLTDYYKMEKLATSKSKNRMDCTISTGGYEPFEDRGQKSREKRFKFYLTPVPDNFRAEARRKGDLSITDTTSISTVYFPDLDTPKLGYGDVKGTKDALLFLFDESKDSVEIFVARGLKSHKTGLFTLFADGELRDEMEALRGQAQPTNARATGESQDAPK